MTINDEENAASICPQKVSSCFLSSNNSSILQTEHNSSSGLYPLCLFLFGTLLSCVLLPGDGGQL